MIPFTLLAAAQGPTATAVTGCGAALVGSWAGMRGVVTLAAALTLPEETPLRAELVVIALVVTVGTLLLQGTDPAVLARRARRARPGPARGRPQEATVLGATTGCGTAAHRGATRMPTRPPSPPSATRRRARVNRSWERLGTLGPGDDETPSEAQRPAAHRR